MTNLKYLLRMLNPFGYEGGEGLENLKKQLSKLYANEDIYITKNGRDALYLFLKSLNLPRGSKVAIQAFVCNAVVNPVLWNNLLPLYIDITEDSFSMDLNDLLKKLDSTVKVLILQHTFGLSADLEIVQECKNRGILVVEDCAHTLGNTNLGKVGDVAMFSFGFEKMLSSRVGGALMVNNKRYLDPIKEEYSRIKAMSKGETFLWLLNPVLWRILRKLPGSVSEVLGFNLVRFGLLSKGFNKRENLGVVRGFLPRSLPGVLAGVVFDCLTRLNSNIEHRFETSKQYSVGLGSNFFGSLVRFPYICVSETYANDKIEKIARLGFPLYDKWYFPVVFPKQTDLLAMKYVLGSCPVAEDISKKIINLPTNQSVSREMVNKIIDIVRDNQL